MADYEWIRAWLAGSNHWSLESQEHALAQNESQLVY